MTRTVLVTRKLPASVIARLEASCAVDLWTGRDPIPREELLARVAGKGALVCLLTDTIDAPVLDAAGPSLQIVANVARATGQVALGAEDGDAPLATASFSMGLPLMRAKLKAAPSTPAARQMIRPSAIPYCLRPRSPAGGEPGP